MTDAWLTRFVVESNRIEGILGATNEQITAHVDFLELHNIKDTDLERFVSVVQPGAKLRTRKGMNVRVGSYIAPPGGPAIRSRLQELLAFLPSSTPYQNHIAYETLHPFTDGNGRSGRALWLWQMVNFGSEMDTVRVRELGFLHTFYYQTLSEATVSSLAERVVREHLG